MLFLFGLEGALEEDDDNLKKSSREVFAGLGGVEDSVGYFDVDVDACGEAAGSEGAGREGMDSGRRP